MGRNFGEKILGRNFGEKILRVFPSEAVCVVLSCSASGACLWVGRHNHNQIKYEGHDGGNGVDNDDDDNVMQW